MGEKGGSSSIDNMWEQKEVDRGVKKDDRTDEEEGEEAEEGDKGAEGEE